MKILVIGYAHGGTAYAAKLLRECGLDILHEDWRGKDGISCWPYAVDDPILDDYGSWKQRGSLTQYDVILHQVREPLVSIRSVEPEPEWTKRFRERHLPDFKHDNPLVQGMRAWTGWNELCDKISDWTYRVEDLPNDRTWDRFKKLCELDKDLAYPNIGTAIPWLKARLAI